VTGRPIEREERKVARRRTRTLTEVELEFMQAVWRAGEATTEDVQAILRRRGRELAGGSVRKVLGILLDKGYVSRRREGRGFVYKARVPKDKAHRSMVADLLKRAFGGSAPLMVATLLDTSAVDEEEIEEIKRLIAERESASGEGEGGQ